ncbi:MAG: hypothetical protein PHT88_01515 [Candidatus Moranbacteria bacterium]|nr:hypothetical protein [Candidatus Moranbacteria bacterium]
MKKMFEKIRNMSYSSPVIKLIEKIKLVLFHLGKMLLWLMPAAIFLIALSLPRMIWNISFRNYLDFVKVLIWPFTALTILFFFKEVVTYLFFSMHEFNFFGAKGNLKNVNEVIMDGVNKKFLEEKNERKRNTEMLKMSTKIKENENEIKAARGNAEENLDLAKDIFKQLRASENEFKEIIAGLETENKRLKEATFGSTQLVSEVNSLPNIDNNATSDPVLEENSN